ncbi:TerD family protein [Streptomyces massasporeus]|uniref:TerD family protein n=1 Tax=Streptomyces massasporeus TaxID=67324 RepID=UPI0033C8DB91
MQSDAAPVSLARGGTIDVATEASELTLAVSFGWEAPDGNSSDFEVDACAIGTRGGRVYSDPYFVFYNNLRTPDNSIVHAAKNAKRDGVQETMLINFAALPAGIDKIVFPVSVYDAESRGQDFRLVRNAYVHLAVPGGRDIARYDIADNPDTATAMIVGELHRLQGVWKFRAVGHGYASGLRGVATDFGVTIMDEEE